MDSKRLFLGLWPDDRQRNILRDALRPLLTSIEGKMVDRRNWHVTLNFIGDFPESKIDHLLVKLAHVEVQPFRLRFDKAEFWPRQKVAVLAAQSVPAELERLIASLNSMLLDAGIAVETRTYRPHITIVRRARPFETQRLAQATLVEWTGFELIESVTAQGSVTYRPLKQ